jgi:hypothetical protein
MVRKKGDKDYSQREKQMMISLINDYSLFGGTDDEMIQMLSVKLGKENNEKISETPFYRLKKEAIQKRGDSEQWLDNYAKYQFIEFYRQRIDELKYVQTNLIKILASETEKEEEKQNKVLINQLAKTISENSKVLAEFGLAPPILAKIKSMIPLDVSTINDNVNKELTNNLKDQSTESNPYIRFKLNHPESAIFPPIDNLDNHVYDNQSNELLTETDDPNRVF